MITHTVEEAAAILKADRTTVLDLIDTGELDAAKFGRQWCIPEPTLAAYILKKVAAQTADRRARAEEKQDDTRQRDRNKSESATTGTRTARRRAYPKLDGH